MIQNILETKCLTKSFRNHCAVNCISLAVPEGCVYGLLGPNGAGKSTLLKMLTGILRPTNGEILFDGHVWSRKDLVDIGALIETPPVYENLTAWENESSRTDAWHTRRKKQGSIGIGGFGRYREEKSGNIFLGNETAAWNRACTPFQT